MKKPYLLAASAIAASALLASSALVAAQTREDIPPEIPAERGYGALLEPLNDSGVLGIAVIGTEGDRTGIAVFAMGLEPGETHLKHIHGSGDEDSTCPPADAAGGDGILTFELGEPYYGPVAQDLEPHEVAGEDGTLAYFQEFTGLDIEDLTRHTIVLHGMSVDTGTGSRYDPSIPVACGKIMSEEEIERELEDILPRILKDPDMLMRNISECFITPEQAEKMGYNVIIGTEDDDVIHGTPGNDYIRAVGGDNKIFGHGGDDIIIGGPGDDQLWGGPGNDILCGVGGDNRLHGGEGSDVLIGGTGDDWLFGNEGDDVMWGGEGENGLVGGPGDDVLIASEEPTFMAGGEGSNVIIGVKDTDRVNLDEGENEVVPWEEILETLK